VIILIDAKQIELAASGVVGDAVEMILESTCAFGGEI
jgi:hypothetical protein